MNRNTAGAVLLLILAAAGLVTNDVGGWAFAAAAAALAFLAEDLRGSGLEPWAWMSGLLSWFAVAASAISLFI